MRRLKYLGAGMLVANVCVFGGLLIILFEVTFVLLNKARTVQEPNGHGQRYPFLPTAAMQTMAFSRRVIHLWRCLYLPTYLPTFSARD